MKSTMKLFNPRGDYIRNEIFFGKFNSKRMQDFDKISQCLGAAVSHDLNQAKVTLIDVDSANCPEDLCELVLKASGPGNSLDIVCEKDHDIYAFETHPNDPLLSQQYSLNIMKMGLAWDFSISDNSLVVAVLDSGIDLNHPDLRNRLWKNEGEIPDNGIDDDNNGYIDDVHGWNFNANNNNVMDDTGHGSHCSGVIGAEANNNIGISGIAWNVRIMPLKVMSKGGGSLSDAIAALDYAASFRVRLSSNSYGCFGCKSELMRRAIISIGDRNPFGHLFIAAAGNEHNDNDFNPSYPCNYNVDGSGSDVICVAATGPRDDFAPYSNWGVLTVHVAAPGSEILSTVAGGQYEKKSGTSMATPHVTGVAALIMQYYQYAGSESVKKIIMHTSVKLPILKDKVIAGRVNAFEALSFLSRMHDPLSNKDYDTNLL